MMLVAYDFSTFGLGWGVALHNGNGIIDFLLFFSLHPRMDVAYD